MPGRITRRRFTNSLMGKLVLTGMLPALLLIAVLAGLSISRRYTMRVDAAKADLAADAQDVALRIEATNRHAIDVARMIAIAQEAGMFGQRERTVSFLRDVLEQFSDSLTAAYVVYEQNADGQDATVHIPGATIPAGMVDSLGNPYGTGRFSPYCYLDWANNNAISLKPTLHMTTNSYYQLPRNNWLTRRVREEVITEPYEYEGQMIVEQTWPILRDGTFLGIAGTDRSLQAMRNAIKVRAQQLGADIFILSPQGRVIVAADDEHTADRYKASNSDPDHLQAMAIRDTVFGDLFGEFLKDTRSNFIVDSVNPGTLTEGFFAVARIPTGDWRVVTAVPRDIVMQPIYSDLLVTVGTSVLGISVMSFILWIPARRLAQRVQMAAAAAQQVAAGDLTRPSSGSQCPDETGELLRALDSMTDDLNTLVGQVRAAGIQLNTVAAELGATSRQQEEMAASFGASSAQIAAAVREITTTGQELAREMAHVSETAGGTAALAQEGRAQLEAMEGAMEALDQATGGVVDRLAAINEKAINITGVVTTITKVAEQTNLLSVNAAIEAEKAGEYGRGFLVVAREIRRLADQTAQATLDIERMVKEMQGAVSSGVMEMDRFSDQVRRNVGDVRTIGRSMQEIIVRVDEGTVSFATVREGMQSQASGAAQIADAMATLTANAKATGDAVRQFGSAADELQRSIGSLKAAIAAFHLRS